jgi:cobalt-zinc-cadmium efflux system outer membrane protein
MRRTLLALAAAAATVSCATTNPADAAKSAALLAASRGAPEAVWASDAESLDALRRRTRELLAAPLTPESAAEIALINEPGLRATLERVGIGQAELAQASRLSNLSISASWLDEEGGPGEKTTLHVGLDILDWLVTPLRKKFAAAELERVKLEVGQAILDSASGAKAALVRYQAAEQMAARLRTIEQIESAAAEFTERLRDAGNASALDLANVRASWAQARADEAQARLEAIRSREEVHRALGLTGRDTQWTAPEELPAPPSNEQLPDALETLAISRRLDVAAARWAVDAVGRALSLKKGTRFFPVGLEVGVETEKEIDGTRVTGPAIALQLPIFDTGAAGVARLEAEHRRVRWQLEALAVEVRSKVREQRAQLQSSRELALFYRDVILPLRAEALDLTLRHYNMMLMGTYDVLFARQREVDAQRRQIEALRDYWLARLELERAVGGTLEPAGPAGETETKP